MEVALLVYHKNAQAIYKKEWVDEFRDSILNQTYKNVSVYEVNYGGDNYRVFEGSDKYAFKSQEFPTFVHALNYLLDHVFSLGYEAVFNTNLDDHYAPNWIEKQVAYMQQGYDLVGSNFALVKDGEITHTHKFHNLDILEELNRGHNPMSHPSISYSKKFWETNRYVPEEIPLEDLLLWQRAIKSGSKAIILEDCLLYHRLHDNSVCKSENR